MVDLEQDLGHSLQILDSAPIGMCIADLSGTLLRVNKSFSRTLGYSSEELQGQSFRSFTYPYDLPTNNQNNERLVRGEISSYTMEKRYIAKDGSILTAIMRVTSLVNDLGQPSYLLAQVIDITDKVDLIQKLSKSEGEFREIFEEAAFAIAKTDVDQNMITVNKAMCDMLEYTEEELCSMNVADVTHPEDFAINKARSSRLIERDYGNYSMEKRYITKSGKVLHGLLKVSYLKGASAETSHLLGQIVDITSIKDLENQLKRRNNELQKVNFELDSFIYRASHDLKGPLATLKGLMNVYQHGAHDKDLLMGMNFSIQKLENTIRELVQFSENTQKSDSEDVEVITMINDCLDVLSHHPRFQNTTIKIDVPTDQVLLADLRRLKPIIINLLINAITYQRPDCDDHGVLISTKSNKSKFVLSIKDNGMGMNKEVSARAFEMFYRGSELSTGSGLGLYLVREMAEKIGGTVKLKTRPEKGTEVIVRIPLKSNLENRVEL